MSEIFHLASFLFIWMEIYGFWNRTAIYEVNMNQVDIKTPLLLATFYVLKLIFYPWLLLGLFTSLWSIYMSLILITLLSFPVIWSLNRLLTVSYVLCSFVLHLGLLSLICYLTISQ